MSPGRAGGAGKAAPARRSTRLKVTQVRSVIGRPRPQRDTVRGLGLKHIHDVVLKEDRPEIRGMLRKVSHLVVVEEVTE